MRIAKKTTSMRLALLSAIPALVCLLFTTGPVKVSAGSNKEGSEFLRKNAKEEGVITLPSGLQYKVLRKGSGTHHPTIDSPCECHYKGTLIDGTQFDSSYDRGQPTTFAPNQVIKGWTEAMQLMVEGDKWEMYIPSDLGYGDRGSPPKIGPGDTLIFTMEIIKINGDKVPALTCKLSGEGCDDKEKEYIAKLKAKGMDASKVEAEISRLRKMTSSSMTDELRGWLHRRLNILEQHKEL